MVKRSDKYIWQVGSPPPPIGPHSLVKHQIVRRYLERYIQVLMSNYVIDKLTLSVVDGFAGGGEYLSEDGTQVHDGSPLIALNTVQEQQVLLNVGRIKERRLDARFYFVEKLGSNFEYLEHLLRTRLPSDRIGKEVHLFRTAFQEVVDSISKDIRERAGARERSSC